MNTIKDETTERMQKCMDSLSNQFNKIRTGRANPSILDSVKVDYYGNQTPINQTAVSYTHLTLPTTAYV